MSSVTPPVPVTLPPPAPALPTATVPAPPPALAELNIGAKLDALILSMTTKGLVDVETRLGKLQLQTGFPLPKNAQVQLHLISKGAQLQFLITAISGKSPTAALRNQAAPSANTPTSLSQPGSAPSGNAAQPAGAVPVSLLAGTKTTATLLRTANFENLNSATAANPSSPTPAKGSVAGQILSSSGMTKAAQGQASTSASPTPAGATAPGQNTAVAQHGESVSAGSRFMVRITSVIPTSQMGSGGGIPGGGPASLTGGQSLTGVVVGQTSSHHPIVNTQAGQLSIVISSPLPPGTTVSFQILSPAPNTAQKVDHAVIERAGSVIMETKSWPTLNESLNLLDQSSPAIAQQVAGAVMPRPDSALTANIIFFLAALRGSEIRNWLGDAPIRELERLRPATAARLGEEFQQISKLSDEESGRDWRAIPIPMLNGSEIEQIRLFMRRKAQDEDNDNPETRFIIDMDLSQIGRIQLDGLIIQGKKRFDLIVRTDNPLTSKIESDLRAIFSQSNEQTGVSGGLSFRSAPPSFTEISTDTMDDDGLGLIV